MPKQDESSGGRRVAKFAPEPLRRRVEAQNLRMASRVLRDHWLETPGAEASGVALPALLLAGYALENYVKARLAEQGETWPGRRGHDLPWLVNEAGIELDESETRLVRRLREVVTWAGRYPDPPKPREVFLPFDDEWPRQASDKDFEMIERICERLEQASRQGS